MAGIPASAPPADPEVADNPILAEIERRKREQDVRQCEITGEWPEESVNPEIGSPEWQNKPWHQKVVDVLKPEEPAPVANSVPDIPLNGPAVLRQAMGGAVSQNRYATTSVADLIAGRMDSAG